MRKKIKILVAVILTLVAMLTISLVAMSLNTTSHCMKINAPDRIIVYYNSVSQNKVFEKDSVEYNQIYSSIINAYQQTVLEAFVNSSLFKDVKINTPLNCEIDFDGVKINFVYDTPQAVKYKNKLYEKDGQNYWYQNLIFDISSADKYQYNDVAIIPPETSNYYTSPYECYLKYSAYSNFDKVYDIVLNMF